MPQQIDVHDRLHELQSNINEAETELAIVERDVEQSKTELERLGVEDPENVGEVIQQTKTKITQLNKRVSGLLTKAEALISRYERRN